MMFKTKNYNYRTKIVVEHTKRDEHSFSNRLRVFITAAGILVFAVLFGCASLTVEEKNEKLTKIDTYAQNTIDKIIRNNPGLNSEFEAAPGYAIFSLDSAKIPWVGYGSGKGVLVDKRNNSRFYLKVKLNALGSGYGAQSFRIILLFKNEKAVQDFKSGKIKFGARADVAAKASNPEGTQEDGKNNIQKDYTVYMYTDAGVAATITVWMVAVSLDKNLN